MLNRFDCVLRNQHTGSSSRRVAGKTLLLCAVATLLIGPGTIKSAPAAPVLQSCRLHTSLNMGDILSGATARRFGQINGPPLYIVTLSLNTNKHIMQCDFDFYCPGNPDKCALRADLSSNLGTVAPRPGNGPCNMVWDMTAVNDSVDLVFGFKVKYEEDYITSGGVFKPRKKNAKLTLHFDANYVEGTDIDVFGTMVQVEDEG